MEEGTRNRRTPWVAAADSTAAINARPAPWPWCVGGTNTLRTVARVNRLLDGGTEPLAIFCFR